MSYFPFELSLVVFVFDFLIFFLLHISVFEVRVVWKNAAQAKLSQLKNTSFSPSSRHSLYSPQRAPTQVAIDFSSAQTNEVSAFSVRSPSHKTTGLIKTPPQELFKNCRYASLAPCSHLRCFSTFCVQGLHLSPRTLQQLKAFFKIVLGKACTLHQINTVILQTVFWGPYNVTLLLMLPMWLTALQS